MEMIVSNPVEAIAVPIAKIPQIKQQIVQWRRHPIRQVLDPQISGTDKKVSKE